MVCENEFWFKVKYYIYIYIYILRTARSHSVVYIGEKFKNSSYDEAIYIYIY